MFYFYDSLTVRNFFQEAPDVKFFCLWIAKTLDLLFKLHKPKANRIHHGELVYPGILLQLVLFSADGQIYQFIKAGQIVHIVSFILSQGTGIDQ